VNQVRSENQPHKNSILLKDTKRASEHESKPATGGKGQIG